MDEIFDRQIRAITIDDKTRRHLGPTVWQVLEILWASKGKPMPKERIWWLVYGHLLDPPDADKVIDVHVLKLRRALIGTPYWIENIYGVGWMLVGRPQSPEQAA